MAKKKATAESRLVRTFPEAVEALSAEPIIALDLETSGLSPWRDRAHVVALHGAVSDTIAVLHYPRGYDLPAELIEWLDDRPEIAMHNGVQFDALFLANAGMTWRNTRVYDSLIAEKATLGVERWDVRVGLAAVIKRHLGLDIDKSIEHGYWGEPFLTENQMAYVTGDIRHMLRVVEAQRAKAAENGTLGCLEFEMALARPVIEMSMNGIPVDLKALERYFLDREEKHLATCAFLAEELGPINLGSHPQLKKVLGERFPGRFPNTKAETLTEYKRLDNDMGRICQAILDWRNFSQRKSMLGDKWQTALIDHGDHVRVHGRFWQIGTHTGRFTSTEPNLQQIPRDMKAVFGNVPGWSVGKSDFASIEVRVAAALAPDWDMIRAFNEGHDIHRVVASAGFGKPPEDISPEERKIAKEMSFTLLFGGGIETFRNKVVVDGGIDFSQAEAFQAVDNFFERFAGIRRMRERAQARAASGGAAVITYPTGLRRVIVGNELRASTLLNNVVQGTAAAGLKKALIYCYEAGLMRYVCAAVHDEIVYVAPTDVIEDVRTAVDDCMIRGMRWALEDGPPIAIGVESTWGPTWKGDPANERKTERMPE